MRGYVVFMLIVCGTFLAAAPVASDFLQGQQIAQSIADQTALQGTTYFRQPLEESYRVATWILGVALIGLGIIKGWSPPADVRRLAE